MSMSDSAASQSPSPESPSPESPSPQRPLSGGAPLDPEVARCVEAGFNDSSFLMLMGARLVHVAPGAVDIAVDFSPDLLQQHGRLHGGVIMTLADVAAGFAALSLLPPGGEVLTSEIKLNLLAAATEGTIVAQGRVVRPGRTLFVCRSDVFALADGTHIATGLASMVNASGRVQRIGDGGGSPA